MPQSTGLVQITNTWVETDGSPAQSVSPVGTLNLCMGMTIDESLLGNGYIFDINWQVIEVATGSINNSWASQMGSNSYPIFIDDWFAQGAGYATWSVAGRPFVFGVQSGRGNAAESQGHGMYILRVYIFIDEGPTDGTDQWATYDDLYFWCDG
jgi:hypothetical protein